MTTKSTDHPSLPLAYELIVPTFDIVLKRLEAVERRIDNTLRFGITVSLAVGGSVIAIQSTTGGSAGLFPDSLGLVAGALTILMFFLFFSVGMWTRLFGKVRILDLADLYDYYITSDENRYRLNLLRHAGQMMQHNERLIGRKARFADWVVVLFVLELISSLVWIWCLLA